MQLETNADLERLVGSGRKKGSSWAAGLSQHGSTGIQSHLTCLDSFVMNDGRQVYVSYFSGDLYLRKKSIRKQEISEDSSVSWLDALL